ncbi:MAG: hypothetical protein JNJ57_20810, partial [Saprospiraceae bacterium]|nr:hypothetical protein [Saprospiraceae bacterium]
MRNQLYFLRFLWLLFGNLLLTNVETFGQTTLSCGNATTGYLSAGETDQYLLSVNNNDKLWLRVYSSDPLINVRVEVKAPSGQVLTTFIADQSGFAELPELTLTQGSGQYRICV